jgi:hypothetical protein
MKNYLLSFVCLSIIGLTGCEKECTSTCGTIANDGIEGNCYWLEIRNSCSGNKQVFCVDQDIWWDSYVGEQFCVTNVSPW